MLPAEYKIDGSDYYTPQNNIPTGISISKDRMFISIGRAQYGIPSTLNYIDFKEAKDDRSPDLRAYPNYEINELHVREYLLMR